MKPKKTVPMKAQRSETLPPQTQDKRGSIHLLNSEGEVYCLITGIAHIPFTGWFVNSHQSYIGLMDGTVVIGSLRIGMENLDIFVDGAPKALIALPSSLR